jgi:membrane fusion protein (multidrug efflux system)
VVPEEAVVNEGMRHIVFVVADNKVDRRVIGIGQRQDGRVEVVEGLKAGETIVVRGVQRVRAGATVNARPVGGPPAPAAGPAAGPAPAAPGAAPSRPAAARSDAPAPGAERRG